MDDYSLTEQNSGIRLSHALFDHMSVLTDFFAEIRFPEAMLTILSDRDHPDRHGNDYAYEAFLQAWLEESFPSSERERMAEALSLPRLLTLKDQVTFEAAMNQADTSAIFRFALSPVLTQDGQLTYVYLSAQSIAQDHLESISLQQTIETATWQQLILLTDALMVCSVHLTSDTIENDFYQRLDPVEQPVLATLGLPKPCSFESFCERWSDQCIPDASRQSFLHLFHRDALLAAWSKGETRVEAEFKATLFNEATAILHCVAALSEAADSHELVATIMVHDVTLKREEEQHQRELLRKANETLRTALEAANRATALRAEFLAKISHNAHSSTTPVAGMNTAAGMHAADSDRLTDYLQKVSVQSRYLLNLMNEVVEMNSFECGKLVLKNEPMSLRDLYTDILNKWLPQITAKHQKPEIHLCALAHEQVIGDRERMTQVLDHLLRNAVHFTPDGGTISLMLSEFPTETEGESRFIFIVRDTGVGISPDRLRTLFDPYSMSEDEELQSDGFDLPISRSIIRKMNGDITVVSEAGKGTTFNVSMQLQLQDSVEDEVDPRLKGRPILVIDDDELNANATEALLTQLGTTPEVVNSGKAAIALMLAYADRAKGNLFAVLINANMENCLSTMATIRSHFGEALPILLSAMQTPEALPTELSEAATVILRQPLFASELTEALGSIADHDETPLQSQTEDYGDETFEGKRVLLVEDNDLNAEIAQELLGALGLECELVTNGREAVDRIAACTEQAFDIILMDLKMPLMNGDEAAQAIRAMDKHWIADLPIAAMSAGPHAEESSRALAAGCNEYIAKPLDECKLRVLLHHLLR